MGPRTLRAAVLPGAAALAVAVALALAGCGTVVAGGGSGSDLPVLRIGVRPVPTGSVAGAPDDPYPLVGTLPSTPTSAPVHRYAVSPVGGTDVSRLAAALGLSGSPVRHAHGVELESTTGTLRVRDGGDWSWSRADDPCPSQRVDVDAADPSSVAVGCAVSSPDQALQTSPTDPKAVAAPVLAAVGLASQPAQVVSYGDTATVSVEPVLGRAVTVGMTTGVVVDATGVRSAYGVLGTPAEGPAYPLIPAARALDVLRAMPRPEPAIACAVGQTCPGVGPQKVTGATLGLLAAMDGNQRVLVPAWLFAVQGSPTPVAVVAVADRYLADPEPSGAGGSGSVGGSSGGSSGSAIPPGEPSTALPTPTASDLPLPIGAAKEYVVSSYSVSSDGRALTLRTTGPMCVSYSGTASEVGGQVRVSIEGAYQQGSQKACPAVMREVEVPAVLGSPLGSRAVVGATTGDAVARRP